MTFKANIIRRPRRSRTADAGSAFVRETRLEAAARRDALRIARRESVIRTLRWTALVAVCFTAAIVLDDEANLHWSRLVLKTEHGAERPDETLASASGARRVPAPIVILSMIEPDDSPMGSARPASLSHAAPVLDPQIHPASVPTAASDEIDAPHRSAQRLGDDSSFRAPR